MHICCVHPFDFFEVRGGCRSGPRTSKRVPGCPMLNRLTVSTLLKAVILSTALVVVIGFSINAWSSWGRLQQANRIVAVSAASAEVFKGMANIRADRSTSSRQLTSDVAMDKDIEKYIR